MTDRAVRLHLTNIAGAGATQLLMSLLPALERNADVRIAEMALPAHGQLSTYRPAPSVRVVVYRRFLPNALSRLLECTLFAGRFSGAPALLVLGDLPLRCRASQTVFVQTPHLTSPTDSARRDGRLKFMIARWVFRINAGRAHSFIVQTPVMRTALARTYPAIADRIHIVAQPVPGWLQEAGLKRRGRARPEDPKLSLAYPAALYPHKNHALLGTLGQQTTDAWPVGDLTLTIPPARHPAPGLPWIKCVGILSPAEMVALYQRIDALLFLSTDESYGFPLIEAMFVGLPIVCPDLPYAHTLCGDGAIYFDPRSASSLREALQLLRWRLNNGWWPDWSAQNAAIPRDWDAVARSMLTIATGPVAPEWA